MRVYGIHHLTAVSADARANHRFYTGLLGMRLVKKTVNQDDTSAYHLFYADGEASPGSDMTFFEWPVGPEKRGTRAISRTAFRVAGEDALQYWLDRLKDHGARVGEIRQIDGRLTLDFEDNEGQRLSLIDDGGAGEAYPWEKSPVPAPFQLRGLGPIRLSVPRLEPTQAFLTEVYEMRLSRTYALGRENMQEEVMVEEVMVHVFEMGEGGPAAELHVAVEPNLPIAEQGAGGVHHVALRCKDADYAYWVERYNRLGLRASGPVDRFYFKSLYVREPSGILIEIATDGPGFATDEPKAQLGETLSLPPFLEAQRKAIEARLKPI